jgi:zinc transport system substrate-binding protein
MIKQIFLLTIFISSLFAKVEVVASIEPESFLLNSIGKDMINITTIVPKGASPHTYKPKPKQMVKLQDAKIYFAIGVEFENVWLEKFKSQNPNLKIVHLDKDIKKINKNPHIWLSIKNLKAMAKEVYNSLIMIDRKNSDFYKKNYENFLKKLTDCNQDIKDILSKKQNKTFMTFHPAFTYFAKEFNLTQIPIEIDGKEPSLKELLKVMKKAKKSGIKTIITSPEFSDKSAKIIANELKANVIKISPLNPNICQTLKQIVNSLK